MPVCRLAVLLHFVLGCAVSSAQWLPVSAPQGRKMQTAVFRPEGDGPFPAVVVLHGTGGFRKTHIELAEHFAKNGFIGVAACWFGGHFRGGRNPVPARYGDGIECPDGPEMKQPAKDRAALTEDLRALISAVQRLPGARADRIGLFGHSRGSVAALVAASAGIGAGAVVAAAGYLVRDVDAIRAPVLVLQGTADDQTAAGEAEQFEKRMRALGKPVEAHYYEGAPHDIPWLAPWQNDVRRRSVEFFKKRLGQ